MEDIESLLASVAGEETPPEPSVEKTPEIKQEDLEYQKKLEQKENLDRAIHEANERLKKIRETTKQVVAGEEEDESVKIDFNDPSSKAWDKHIKAQVNPAMAEIEKEKEEIRTFALREFLADKPSLSKNPEKLKEMMETYQKIKTASERTTQGVMIDLNKAFAATFSEELVSQVRESGFNRAKGDALFSDPAVSRGSTAYYQEHNASPTKSLSDDDKAILAKWGMTPDEWGTTKTEMDKKYQ